MQKDCINDFSLLPFFPVVKAKGKFSAAQPGDPPQKIISPSSCLSNHIVPCLWIPACPQALPLFCLWDLKIPSMKKFCFMQLSSGKYIPPLYNRSLFIYLLCVLILYLPKLPTGSPDVYLKPLAPTHQLSTFSFLAWQTTQQHLNWEVLQVVFPLPSHKESNLPLCSQRTAFPKKFLAAKMAGKFQIYGPQLKSSLCTL